MIDTSNIQITLNNLEELYEEANEKRELRKLQFFSKLAIIEVCTWIEEIQDTMLMQLMQNEINDANRKYIEKIIKRNYGFRYDENFRKLLLNIIGIIELEKIERKLEDDKGALQRLRTELGNFKKKRDQAAHTHIKEVTEQYDAVSLTKSRFDNLVFLLNLLSRELILWKENTHIRYPMLK
ncbi:hypothetical protein [Synechocystis sp. CS-94]|nr:hypothetical protein [Synechocystis sp. CS-94]MCT0253315.1 hypothetical protein [Synechocystis sp. CS-94]